MTCTSDGFMFVGMDSGSIKVLSCRRGGTRETIVHGNVKRILFGIAFGHQTSCGNDHVLQMWLLLLEATADGSPPLEFPEVMR